MMPDALLKFRLTMSASRPASVEDALGAAADHDRRVRALDRLGHAA